MVIIEDRTNTQHMKRHNQNAIASILFLLLTSISFGQSELSNAKNDCKYTLQWNCDECTFEWSGDCLNNLPEGEGALTVYHDTTEIMWYEGGMKNGVFNGEGSYRDGMSQMDGEFENGRFIDNNPFYQQRINMIDTTSFNKTDQWETKSVVTKQIDNLYFTFPSTGYGYENRDMLVKKCTDAFRKNCALINDTSYTEFTRIMFVDSKTEMLLHSDLFIKGGAANIWTRSIHMVISDEGTKEQQLLKPPISHEIMHMVAMTAWGNPSQNVTWLNEGLATFSENSCSGYSVAEIYRYFLAKKMLIPIESLTRDFYQTEEMIGYHQSAYIVEYLISHYGIEKLEALWKNGFTNFENIYGLTFAQMETELNLDIMKTIPKTPKIDWEILKEGCK